MKGDFSRNTFDPRNHYCGVLMQQGRVQIDADWNEQLRIQRHLRETAYRDIIGACGAPHDGGGFQIQPTSDNQDLMISPGRIYVEGVMCELESSRIRCQVDRTDADLPLVVETLLVDGRALAVGERVEIFLAGGSRESIITRIEEVRPDRHIKCTWSEAERGNLSDLGAVALQRVTTYLTQPDYPRPDTRVSPPLGDNGSFYLAYLDVWQRHITALDDPSIREVALGGPDTATRMKTVWQVKLLPLTDIDPGTLPSCNIQLDAWDWLTAGPTGKLRAQSNPEAAAENPCLLPHEAGYQGFENQLYRVEIHDAGDAGDASFKWSRDNGVVVTAIESIDGIEVTVQDLGRDEVLGFADGQWVEIFDDDHVLHARPGVLARVQVDPDRRVFTFPEDVDLSGIDPDRNGRVRRWDGDGVQSVVSGEWIVLENGVEVQFSVGNYRTGDFWLVPARTATADVEWPRDAAGEPLLQHPLGITHRYCRLAVISWNAGANTVDVEDCRRLFDPLTSLESPSVSTRSAAIHVQAINWDNDDFLDLVNFEEGLTITIDEPIDQNEEILKSAIDVSLQIPLKDDSNNVIGWHKVVLNSNVSLDESNQRIIIWEPESAELDGLAQYMHVLSFGNRSFRVGRVWVSVKGSFLWTQRDGRPLYLDGKAFGRLGGRREDNSPRTDLRFPSGAGMSASDFESWFDLRIS